MHRRNRRMILVIVIALILSMSWVSSVSSASGHHEFQWFVGENVTGPTFDVLGIDFPPAVAMAPNGDTIVMNGEGTLTIHPKSATGEGTFTHVDAAGNVVASGTWTATELLSFHPYGSASAQGLPEDWFGGQALIRVVLSPEGTSLTFDATLQVDCVLGDKIPTAATEGIRLNVRGINFNEEVSGATLFIRQ